MKMDQNMKEYIYQLPLTVPSENIDFFTFNVAGSNV